MREQDGKEVVIGLRPEHITDSENPDSGATTQLDLTLEVLEPTGPDTIAMIKVNEQEVACRLSPEFDVTAGQVAPLHFDLSKAVFFDAATEQRIEFN
jgi:multiple sugar transport system ATP-binding protein